MERAAVTMSRIYNPDNVKTWERQMKNLKKEATETYEVYSKRVQALCKQAYSTGHCSEEMLNRLTIKAFVDGLPNELALRVTAHGDTTLDDVIKNVQYEEDIMAINEMSKEYTSHKPSKAKHDVSVINCVAEMDVVNNKGTSPEDTLPGCLAVFKNVAKQIHKRITEQMTKDQKNHWKIKYSYFEN